MPGVSVIVPIYNAEKYLKNSIENLLRQTFNNFEIILINDGSTDSSGKICNYFEKKNNKIKVIHTENQGVGLARNKGIEMALGKYIMFYDIDDILDNTMLQNMYNKIEKKKVDLLICSYKDIGIENNNILVKRENKVNERDVYGKGNVRKIYIELYKEAVVQATWAKLYKREIIKNNNIKFPRLTRCEDIIFNIEYYKNIDSLSVINQMYYYYLTLNRDEYLNKLPKDIFNISRYVNEYVVNSIRKWGLLDDKTKRYFSGIIINDAALSLRLCINKKWNMNNNQRKEYINKIVNDSYLNDNLYIKQDRKLNDIISKIIRTKNYRLIMLFNNGVVFCQKYIPKMIINIKR